MACERYKTVFVILEEIGSASRLRYFELVIEEGEDGGETDCSRLVKEITRNSPDCTELLKKGELTFTIESVKFPGRYVEFNPKSPIGDGRCIKCSVVRGMELAEKNKQESVLSDTTKHHQQTAVPEPDFTITEDELFGFLNNTSSEVECDFDILTVIPQNGIDHDNLQEKEKSKQKEKALNLGTPQLHYKLPSTFDQSIQQKLNHGKEKLLLNEYATFARDLSRPIMSLTQSPDSSLIEFVVERAMEKYPLVVIADTDDPGPTKRLLVEKIRAICGRQRRKGGGKLSAKGGRPPKVKASNMSLGPGRNHRGVDGFDERNFDWLSYHENVKKMIQLSNESPIATPALLQLWKLTFSGRRRELETNVLPQGVFPVITTRCPILRQQQCLLEEFDMICGPGTCRIFRENWLKLVPNIIDIAGKQKNSNKVAEILHRYRSLESADFETSSCAALELLPSLLPTRKLKDSCRFFFDCHEDSVNLAEAIKKPHRESPFILKHGSSFHIIADSKPYLYVSGGSMDALVSLIATYYVFHQTYAKEVLTTLQFIQSQVLAADDADSKYTNALTVFIQNLRKLVSCNAE